MSDLLEHYLDAHGGKPRSELTGRREEIITRTAELEGYPRRSQAQAAELDGLIAEQIAVDDLIKRDDVEIRRAKIAEITRIAQDESNLERPAGAPSLVTRPGDQPETAQQIIARSGNPWAARSGPLDGHTSYGRGDTAAGVISRAHSALEALEGTQPGTLPREGLERLAQAFAESSGWPGMTVKRSRDEQAEAAELFLALSNPHYHEAFRSVLRYPMEFTGAGGTGFETFTDDQRAAWRDVRTNLAVRAAFAESSGAAGAFALPLQLDSTVMVVSGGVVGPFRKLARTVIGTSNVWEGLTSQGSTANWVAEGVAVTDTTPTLAQVAITPYKSAVWCFASVEIAGDTQLDEQIPGLIAEARSRLELTAFTTGTGTAQPFGVIARGASDATVGALTAAMIYGLHQNIPPRFRSYDTARPAWISNVTIQDACRQIPSFAGSVSSIVNDNGDVPTMLGLPYYEASAMDASNAVSGHKNLCLGDWSQMILVERLPSVMVYEPLVVAQASALPTGQVGFYSYARVGSDITTPAAAYGSNAFVFHTT
jgi:HK97 family phage major capsid protein